VWIYVDFFVFDRFVRRNHIHTVLFIPYAKKDMDSYAERYKAKMGKLGVKVQSIHEMHDPVSAVEHAAAIAIGGGNTFLLLKRLYDAGIGKG
jgi:dipeptidase E